MSHSTVEPNLKRNREPQSQARTHGLLPCLLVFWLMSPLSATAAIDRAAIASGVAFSCALLTDGSVQCWGSNSRGQLGDGTTDNRSRPVVVDGLAGGVVQLAAGTNHACAVLQDQRVKCWGRNDSGQLGDGSTVDRSIPVAVKVEAGGDLTGVVEVGAGNAHTCARLDTGAVKCWGSRANGRLGDDSTSLQRPTAGAVTGIDGAAPSTSATAISVGELHSCAARKDGIAVCWGHNDSGRLGDGSTVDRPIPVPVKVEAGGDLTGVVELAAGSFHSCARLSSGVVQCWGSRANGRLGDDSTSPERPTAGAVTGIDGSSADASAIAISSGGSGSCALMADKSLRCWGAGTRNGDGTDTDALTPSKVLASGSDQNSDPVFSDAVAVSVGGTHGCALVEGGGVWCWGDGSQGQLGDGVLRTGSTLSDLSALNPVAVLSSGTASDSPVPFSAIAAGFPSVLSLSVNGPNEALADGDETVTVSVAVSDGFADPVAGQSVFFTATPSAGVAFTTNPIVTGADGSATTSISATEAGDITITAFLGTSASGTVSDIQVVTFNPVPTSPEPPAQPFIPEPVPVNSPWALALLVLLMLGWGLRYCARVAAPWSSRECGPQ